MPWRRFRIETHLSPDETRDRMRELTKPPLGFWESVGRTWSSSKDDQPFIGEVGPDGFRIKRDIRYRNSFLPVIRGQVTAAESGGSVVTLQMSLHVLVAAFMAVWFGVVIFAGLAMVTRVSLVSGDYTGLIPPAMLVAGIGIVAIGFYPEARKAERILRSALAAPSNPAT